jgi:predicted MFS family arabinose efflux permease
LIGQDVLTKRQTWIAVLVLLVLYTLNSADRFVIAVVIEPIKHEFQLSDTQLGAVGGLAHAIAYSAFVIPIGYLLDRFNRVKLLAGMLAIWSVITACGAFATGFWSLFLMRMGVGAAESASSPGSQSLIASYFPIKQRSSAMGVVFSGAAMGTGLIFAIGGPIAAHWGWRAVFLVAGIPGILLAIYMWFNLPEPPRRVIAKDVSPPPSMWQVSNYFFRTSPVLLIALGTTIASMNLTSVWVWISPILIRQQGFSLVQAGLIVGVAAGVIKFASTLLSGFLGDWIARGQVRKLWVVPTTALALSFPFALIIATTSSQIIAGFMVLLLGMTLGTHHAAPKSVIMTLVPEEMRGRVAAIEQLMVNLLGAAAGPLITGMISDRLGGPNSVGIALAATVSLNLVAAFFYWKAMHRLENAPVPPVAGDAAAI